jgi:hypothetical protein
MKKCLLIFAIFFTAFSIAFSQSKSVGETNSYKFFSENHKTHNLFSSDSIMIIGLEKDTIYLKNFNFPLLDLQGDKFTIRPFFHDENSIDIPSLRGFFDPVDNMPIYKPNIISPIPTSIPDTIINHTLIIKKFK